MMRCSGIILGIFLAGCGGLEVRPPVPVEVQVPVAVPCAIEVPACQVPAYDAATKDQPMDLRVKLLRVEAIEQAECLKRTRIALEACRAGAGSPAR